ncbi:MAG: hotdog fold thioesterase [Gaiellales bacterium]
MAQLDHLYTAAALPEDPRPGTRPLADTALGALGIELLECGADRVVARMPVDGSTAMRSRMLVLAETAASTAAGIAAGPGLRAFGTELNASIVATPAAGPVLASALPLMLGTDRHVWRIVACDATGARVLEARCTLSIVATPPAPRVVPSAPAH